MSGSRQESRDADAVARLWAEAAAARGAVVMCDKVCSV